MTAVVLTLIVGAVEVRGEVQWARFGPNAEEWAQPGDEMVLTIPDWEELPPYGHREQIHVDLTIGDRDVRSGPMSFWSSATHAHRRIETSTSHGGHYFNVDIGSGWGSGFSNPWDRLDYYQLDGSILSVTGLPEATSAAVWATGLILLLLRRRHAQTTTEA